MDGNSEHFSFLWCTFETFFKNLFKVQSKKEIGYKRLFQGQFIRDVNQLFNYVNHGIGSNVFMNMSLCFTGIDLMVYCVLSSFSRKLPAYYHKFYILIGYRTLFNN